MNEISKFVKIFEHRSLLSFRYLFFFVQKLKFNVLEKKLLKGILLNIKVFLSLDWRSIIKSNLLIFWSKVACLAFKKCHHLKPKYLRPGSKVVRLILKCFNLFS